jgi:hypothetical protein
MKKIILWSVTGILILGICSATIWWMSRPQVIQLDKNTKLTLLGVEYGKHHKFPKIATTGRRNFGGPNSFDTTNDALVVYVLQETKGQNHYGWQALVYDRAETTCVQSWARQWNQAGANKQIAAFQLDAFPRRDSEFFVRFQSWSGGQRLSKDKFVIVNPARGKTFSKWTPDPLPSTQSDGDLDVTLSKLVTAPSPWGREGIAKNDPANQVVLFDFDVQQKGQSVTNWRPVYVETSDATGNDIKGSVNEYDPNGTPVGYFYQNGLWPNESAWKVRLEFSRTSGFNDDELWSVTNIPVRAGTQQDAWNYWNSPRNGGKTNAPFAETTINGVHLKMFPALQYVSQNGNNGKVVGITLQTDPDLDSAGMRMTPLSATDDAGHELKNQGASWTSSSFHYEFGEARKVDSVNVTIALHKSRLVEFMIKPTKQ